MDILIYQSSTNEEMRLLDSWQVPVLKTGANFCPCFPHLLRRKLCTRDTFALKLYTQKIALGPSCQKCHYKGLISRRNMIVENKNMLEEVEHNSVHFRIHPLLRVWQAHLSPVLFPYAGNCVPVPISMTSSAFSWGHAINSLTLKLSQKCHYELNSENCLSFRGHTVPVEKR